MNKNTRLSKFFRFAITFAVVSLALFLGLMLWESYMNSPWTRDGRVRADVTMVAPDVSGLVSRVAVRDNQHVKAGEVLFEIDSERFRHALSEAQATLAAKKAVMAMKTHQASRRAAAGDEVVSRESAEDAAYEAAIARADVEEAHARVESARLDLERSYVRAPSEGWVS
ncbi:MAG: biotin/lipoyl-binding protein, partial [Campylobacterota bacterium]